MPAGPSSPPPRPVLRLCARGQTPEFQLLTIHFFGLDPRPHQHRPRLRRLRAVPGSISSREIRSLGGPRSPLTKPCSVSKLCLGVKRWSGAGGRAGSELVFTRRRLVHGGRVGLQRAGRATVSDCVKQLRCASLASGLPSPLCARGGGGGRGLWGAVSFQLESSAAGVDHGC